jgi:selenide,water dikinase
LLTKPLGTGLLATAAKNDRLSARERDLMLASMVQLNRDASRAALTVGAICATDITGFGLLGHANHIAKASKKTLRINVAAVPALEGAREAWLDGVRTGGAERNEQYLRELVEWGDTKDVDRALLIDPQTSGGLLVAVSPRQVAEYVSLVPSAVEIGNVVEPSRLGIVLV